MKKFVRLTVGVLALACVAVPAEGANAKADKAAAKAQPAEETMISETKLPEKVRATFVYHFPNAVINKLASVEAGGVTVWDIAYRDGKSRKKANIADDGTMLGRTVPITKKSAPRQVMMRFEEITKQEGAEIGKMERLEVSYETKNGKVVKLDKPVTRYALEMIKGGQATEIVVDEKGKVIDEAKRDTPKAKNGKKAAA